MIAKVGDRGVELSGFVNYAFGPGKSNEHTNQRWVAAFDGRVAHWQSRHFDDLRKIIDQPFRAMRHVPKKFKPVWQCSIAAAASDGKLSDEQWAEIAQKVADEVGLTENNVRWAAINHGLNNAGCDHIHLIAVMVNDQTLKPFYPKKDKLTASVTARSFEQKFGLERTGLRNSTGLPDLKRAEIEKALRKGERPTREVLREKVRLAKNRSVTLKDFEHNLEDLGVEASYRYSKKNEGEVTGIRFADQDDPDAIAFGGSKLAKDLSWNKLKPFLQGAEAKRYSVQEKSFLGEEPAEGLVYGGLGPEDLSLVNVNRSVSPVEAVGVRDLDGLFAEAIKKFDGKESTDLVEATECLLQSLADQTGDEKLLSAVKEYGKAVAEPYKKVPKLTEEGRGLREAVIAVGMIPGKHDMLRLAMGAYLLVDSVQRLRRTQASFRQVKAAVVAKENLVAYMGAHPEALNNPEVKALLQTPMRAPVKSQERDDREYLKQRALQQQQQQNNSETLKNS